MPSNASPACFDCKPLQLGERLVSENEHFFQLSTTCLFVTITGTDCFVAGELKRLKKKPVPHDRRAGMLFRMSAGAS